MTDYALQHDRSRVFHPDSDEQLSELVAWLDDGFPAEHPFSKAAPIPTIDVLPRLFVLGSSGWSAAAAGRRGLRYVFAGFINQEGTPAILDLYRRRFKPYDGPSGIQEPSLILAVHVVCQDDEDEARRHLAPVHVMYRNLARGQINRPNLTPDEAVAKLGGPPELERYVPGSGVPPKFIGGTPERVAEQLLQLAHDLGADEIMIQDMIVDQRPVSAPTSSWPRRSYTRAEGSFTPPSRPLAPGALAGLP